jgi:hypothetical protein
LERTDRHPTEIVQKMREVALVSGRGVLGW